MTYNHDLPPEPQFLADPQVLNDLDEYHNKHRERRTAAEATDPGRLPKPPLGLRPKWLADEQRIAEVLAAISRYETAGWDVPQEWRDEVAVLAAQTTDPGAGETVTEWGVRFSADVVEEYADDETTARFDAERTSGRVLLRRTRTKHPDTVSDWQHVDPEEVTFP